MNQTDSEYFRLLRDILTDGRKKNNRTGVPTIGIFGAQAKFPVSMDAFPILTTKRVWFKGIVHELLWFIKGDTNIKYLVDNDVHIWDEWAYKAHKEKYPHTIYDHEGFIDMLRQLEPTHDFISCNGWGELGKGTYGGMWRDFPVDQVEPGSRHVLGVDQLGTVVNKLKTNPDDRRMIVSAWHP